MVLLLLTFCLLLLPLLESVIVLCFVVRCFVSVIAIILMGKRELVALLNLSFWCLVMVERLFLAVPQGCLQFVIVVFPDHTHLLFLSLDICGRTVKLSFLSCGFKGVRQTTAGNTHCLGVVRAAVTCVMTSLTVFFPERWKSLVCF